MTKEFEAPFAMAIFVCLNLFISTLQCFCKKHFIVILLDFSVCSENALASGFGNFKRFSIFGGSKYATTSIFSQKFGQGANLLCFISFLIMIFLERLCSILIRTRVSITVRLIDGVKLSLCGKIVRRPLKAQSKQVLITFSGIRALAFGCHFSNVIIYVYIKGCLPYFTYGTAG